jgi:hypothetical protein
LKSRLNRSYIISESLKEAFVIFLVVLKQSEKINIGNVMVLIEVIDLERHSIELF